MRRGGGSIGYAKPAEPIVRVTSFQVALRVGIRTTYVMQCSLAQSVTPLWRGDNVWPKGAGPEQAYQGTNGRTTVLVLVVGKNDDEPRILQFI